MDDEDDSLDEGGGGARAGVLPGDGRDQGGPPIRVGDAG